MKNQIKHIIHDPSLLFVAMAYRGLLNWMSDEQYIKIAYRIKMGKKLNFDNPQTFNEKLQWLKLYDRKPVYTQMVDKIEAKKLVAGKIGQEYIIPTLGVWDRFDDIDFGSLPNQFVLKCSHDSGSIVICKDKSSFDVEKARKKINKCLKRNFFWVGREWPYKNVKPRILAEPYLEDEETHELRDYKLMVFNGKVKCSFTVTERFSEEDLKVTFFDTEWKTMPFERHYPKSETEIRKPLNYDEMVELAEKLADDIPFARIDFYEVGKKTFYGEITLYPGSGVEEFSPFEWDKILGSWIKLPQAGEPVKTL